jgi:GH25 family lysozyme M1 (1,4-beta-N-acetylmuramidase)
LSRARHERLTDTLMIDTARRFTTDLSGLLRGRMVWPVLLLRGAYNAFDFFSSSDEQFKVITETVPKEQNSLPMAIDVEWDGVPRTPSQRSCHNIGKNKATPSWLLVRLEKFYGNIPIIHRSAAGVGAILNADFNRVSDLA